jgi:hypothetical protein
VVRSELPANFFVFPVLGPVQLLVLMVFYSAMVLLFLCHVIALAVYILSGLLGKQMADGNEELVGGPMTGREQPSTFILDH